MQGTNSGAHLNLGEIRMPADTYKVFNGADLALQAADQGFLAISYERIGYGERQERNLKKVSMYPTLDISLHSIILGSSLLGETVNELISIIDWLKKEKYNLPIWIVGYSSAGYSSLITAAIETRINGIAIGGCIGSAQDTLLKRGQTAFLEVPSMLEWFDQDSILALMSPRPTIVIAGEKDHIWPYKGAKKIVEQSKQAFLNLNQLENLKLIKGKLGHTYYPKLMWSEINKYF